MHCDGCGKKRKLEPYFDHLFCRQCSQIAETLKCDKELLKRISILIHEEDTAELIDNPQELPDVLDAVRYRTRDRDHNTWYVSVSELKGEPVEIFASTAFDRDQHLQSRISHLTTITRLISLILRNVFLKEQLTLDKTMRQLLRSSRQKNDLPDMLSRVLANYSPNEVHPYDEHDTI